MLADAEGQPTPAVRSNTAPNPLRPNKRVVKNVYSLWASCRIFKVSYWSISSCFQLLLLVWKVCLAQPNTACEPGADACGPGADASDKCLGPLTASRLCLPCILSSPLSQLLNLLGNTPNHVNAVSGEGREEWEKKGNPFTRPSFHSYKWNPQEEGFHPKPGGSVERKQRLAIKRSE